jgi:hypothetical protein
MWRGSNLAPQFKTGNVFNIEILLLLLNQLMIHRRNTAG